MIYPIEDSLSPVGDIFVLPAATSSSILLRGTKEVVKSSQGNQDATQEGSDEQLDAWMENPECISELLHCLAENSEHLAAVMDDLADKEITPK